MPNLLLISDELPDIIECPQIKEKITGDLKKNMPVIMTMMNLLAMMILSHLFVLTLHILERLDQNVQIIVDLSKTVF